MRHIVAMQQSSVMHFICFVLQFNAGNVFAGSATFQARFEEAYKRFFDEINKRGKSHSQYRERYK